MDWQGIETNDGQGARSGTPDGEAVLGMPAIRRSHVKFWYSGCVTLLSLLAR